MSLVRYSLRASSPIWASEPSLARTRFTRPNRRACSQARCVTIRLFVTVEPPIYIVCYPVIPSLLVFLLPCGRVRELIPISDQLQLRPLFGISEVAAYERLDCCWNLVNSVWTTSTSEVLHYFHVCLVVLLFIVHNLMVLYNTLTRHTKISNAGVILSTHLYIQRKGTINTNGHNLGVKQDHMRKETQRVGKQ